MPKVTIWIRVEDEAKWKAIEKKPEWLHEHLNSNRKLVGKLKDTPVYSEELSSTTTNSKGVLTEEFLEQHMSQPSQYDPQSVRLGEYDRRQSIPKPSKDAQTIRLPADGQGICEHYQPKGECMVKGCTK